MYGMRNVTKNSEMKGNEIIITNNIPRKPTSLDVG